MAAMNAATYRSLPAGVTCRSISNPPTANHPMTNRPTTHLGDPGPHPEVRLQLLRVTEGRVWRPPGAHFRQHGPED